MSMSFRISDDVMREMLSSETLSEEDRKKLLELKKITDEAFAADKKSIDDRVKKFRERSKEKEDTEHARKK